jgi:hypothetical protein
VSIKGGSSAEGCQRGLSPLSVAHPLLKVGSDLGYNLRNDLLQHSLQVHGDTGIGIGIGIGIGFAHRDILFELKVSDKWLWISKGTYTAAYIE